MKRNNLLMLSFIALMAICAFIKSFWDYPMWTTIVAAITVASWMFAIADFCFSQAVGQIKIADEQLSDTEEALLEIELISKAIDVRLQQLNTKHDESGSSHIHTRQDEINHVTSVKSDIEVIEADLKTYKDQLIKGQNSAKVNRTLGSGITFLGFLLFFIIIIFNPLMEAPVEGLDELTVWAFAIILFSQYMETLMEGRREEKKLASQKNVKALNVLRKSFESEVKHNAD